MLSGLCFAKPFSMVNNSKKRQSNARDPFPPLAPCRQIPFLAWKIDKLYHIHLKMWYRTLSFTRLSSHCEKIHCRTGWQPHLLLFSSNNYFNVFKNGTVSGGSIFTAVRKPAIRRRLYCCVKARVLTALERASSLACAKKKFNLHVMVI